MFNHILKSNNNFLSAKPEPKILTCEIHGEYSSRSTQVIDKFLEFDNCEKCYEILKVERDEKAKADRKLRAAMSFKTRKHNSGISNRYFDASLDNLAPCSAQQARAIDYLRVYSSEIMAGTASNSVIITGGVGTGKTMMASALINSIVERKQCEIIKCIDLIRSLKATWNRNNEQTEKEIIEKYTQLDLLVIDEVGVQFGSDTEKMFIFDVIDGRYENALPTVLISNQPMNKISEFIGDRVVDRLRQGGGELFVLDGESGRK